MASATADLRGSPSVSSERQSQDVVSDVFGESVMSSFENWMDEHEKEYETVKEKAGRLLVWLESDRLIEEHNSQVPPPSFFVGHNQFSDLTHEEYQEYNKLGDYSPGIYGEDGEETKEMPELDNTFEEAASMTRKLDDLPDEVNWVEAGAVTRVKNQKMCGSCWAFSAAASMEGAYFLKTGKLVNFSVQQLLDCDPTEKGCKGGLMSKAFIFEKTMGGMCTYEEYPYVAKKNLECGKCDQVEGSMVTSYFDIPKSVEGLMEGISIQPVSVAIFAKQLMFKFYRSGVFNQRCWQKVDHGVLAVGYGTDEDTGLDYWLVKNSWGNRWGDEGYIKIARESSNNLGKCGIQRLASRPILE